MRTIQTDWYDLIKPEFRKEYYKCLMEFLKNEYYTKTVYPPKEKIYSALNATPYENIKAVILGQDPYHGPNQAHGLAFSVNPGIAIPKSLINIFKELHDDIGCPIPKSGYLQKWGREGVLMLNTILTVRRGEPLSHKDKGWEILTDKIISMINEKESPVVFILWGAPARSKKRLITNPKHLILEAPHPSPLSAFRGFFGSKPFSKTNQFLVKNNIKPIDWDLST